MKNKIVSKMKRLIKWIKIRHHKYWIRDLEISRNFFEISYAVWKTETERHQNRLNELNCE